MSLTGERIQHHFRGRQRTLSEIATLVGIDIRILYQRWRRGVRGEQLVQPVRKWARRDSTVEGDRG